MTWSASLQIRSDLAELTRLAEWLAECGAQHGVPDEAVQQVDLCAAETVTNVITHGVADAAEHRIELRIGQNGDEVFFEVEDDGIEFDPTQAPLSAPVTMDCDRVGGWGMRIVRKLSDEIRYRRVDGRNRLTLVFRLRPPVAA